MVMGVVMEEVEGEGMVVMRGRWRGRGWNLPNAPQISHPDQTSEPDLKVGFAPPVG